MSELRSVLERLADRTAPASDGFERLERRRRRRQRNRRALTVAVALAVALAGSVGAFVAFRHPAGTTPAEESPSFHALWPEQTAAAALATQDKVDGGDPSLRWRLDPAGVGWHFAADFLGLKPPQDARSLSPQDARVGELVLGSDLLRVVIHIPPAPCPSPGGPSCLAAREVTLTLARLVRVGDGGIWSVISVDSGALSLPIDVGADVQSGQEIAVPFTVPDGLQASAGYAYFGDCSGLTSFSPVRQVGDELRFHVAGSSFQERCGDSSSSAGGSSASNDAADLKQPVDGYVFVVLLLKGAEPIDPFEPSFQRLDLAQPVSLAAVPVHFVPASTEAHVPGVARIICDGAKTRLARNAVAAQDDGVHLTIDNGSGADLSIEFRDIGGPSAPAGTIRAVWALRPGTVDVRCEHQDGTPAGQYVTLRVEDPTHVWVSPDLECGGGAMVGGAGSFTEGATGEKGDPVDIVRRTAKGLLASDIVEAAGYPDGSERQVRVVRQGATVAVFHFMPDGKGGWLADSFEACADAGLGGEASPGGSASG